MNRRDILKGLIYTAPLLTTVSAFAGGYGDHGSGGASNGKPDPGKPDKPDRPDPSPPSPPDHSGEPSERCGFLKGWEC